MKTCTKCGESKSLSDFYKATGMRDGRRNDCITCNKAAQRARYKADPATAIAKVKEWQQKNSSYLNAYRQQRRELPEVKRAQRSAYLKRKYGISIEDYEAMLERQGGVCAICSRPPRPGVSLHVDHEHGTNRIRGLLHFQCNNLLGDAYDNAAWLRAAASYLEAREREPELDARLAELMRMRDNRLFA